MDKSRVQELVLQMEAKATAQLEEVVGNTEGEWAPEAVEAARRILLSRGAVPAESNSGGVAAGNRALSGELVSVFNGPVLIADMLAEELKGHHIGAIVRSTDPIAQVDPRLACGPLRNANLLVAKEDVEERGALLRELVHAHSAAEAIAEE
ncbi:MAG TPA: hypothetical protein VGN26_18600 [Armatimonadota bacterium]|jgi:hypothetical protein